MVSSSIEKDPELFHVCVGIFGWSVLLSSLLKEVQAVEVLLCCFTEEEQLVSVVDANEVFADFIGSLKLHTDLSGREFIAESTR